MIIDDDFEDPVLIARRQRDHERIDQILARQVTQGHAIVRMLICLIGFFAGESAELTAFPSRGSTQGLA